MGEIAFYAPMKSPNHAIPSGDREMARALMRALAGQGAQVDLVSEMRIYDGRGDRAVQQALVAAAEVEVARLIELGRAKRWQFWVSYHNYYKAPDLIGPVVSAALGIPYVLIEATRAHKRLNGPWADFAHYAEAASDHADLIFYFTEQDGAALVKYAPDAQKLVNLPPFLARSTLPVVKFNRKKPNRILSVGMLRAGDKAASYKMISEVLVLLETKDWHLDIVGDGAARREIEALFETVQSQVSFLGQLDQTGLARAYEGASVFLWPGVNEAFGMVYLEAQAAGLPVIAQNRPGVCDVVLPAGLVAQNAGARGLARAVDNVLASESLRVERGVKSRDYICENHLLEAATATLLDAIATLV